MATTATGIKTFSNFIDGKWVPATSGNTCENRNPADTRDIVGIFQRSGAAEVNLAVEAAQAAFKKWIRPDDFVQVSQGPEPGG